MEFYKKQKFSIRKLSLGVCSVLVGIALFGVANVSAEEKLTDLSQASDVALVNADAPKEEASEEAQGKPASEEASQAAQLDTENQAVVEDKKPVVESQDVATVANKEEKPATKEAKVVEDLPSQEDKKLKPKEVKFDTWQDLLNWKPGDREDDDINRASVPLALVFYLLDSVDPLRFLLP